METCRLWVARRAQGLVVLLRPPLGILPLLSPSVPPPILNLSAIYLITSIPLNTFHPCFYPYRLLVNAAHRVSSYCHFIFSFILLCNYTRIIQYGRKINRCIAPGLSIQEVGRKGKSRESWSSPLRGPS